MQYLILLLGILLPLAEAAAIAKSSTKTNTKGTWTFYSTATATVTTATSTEDSFYTTYIYSVVTTSNTIGSTYTNTVYTSTITEQSGDITTYTQTVTASPTKTVKSASPPGLVPIQSEFPYTAKLKITTISTTTYSVAYYFTPSPTATATDIYYPDTYLYETATGASTYTQIGGYSYVTVTAPAPIATRWAACEAGSHNFIDHYPYTTPFGPRYGPLDGSTVVVVPHTQDLLNDNIPDRHACCNICLNTPNCIGGFFGPLGLLGGTNECQVYLLPNATYCDPSKTYAYLARSLFDAPGSNYSGYYSFNGQCGQVAPYDHQIYY